MSAIRMTVAGVLVLQGLLVTAGAASTVRDPARAASLYTGQATKAEPEGGRDSLLGATIAIFVAPLQAVVAVFMLYTAYALFADAAGAARLAVFMLGVFAVMELLFVGVRLRLYALRRNEPSLASPLVGRRGLVTSLVLSVVYAVSGISLSLMH